MRFTVPIEGVNPIRDQQAERRLQTRGETLMAFSPGPYPALHNWQTEHDCVVHSAGWLPLSSNSEIIYRGLKIKMLERKFESVAQLFDLTKYEIQENFGDNF
ncbi:MAG: hypothetical protein ACP5FH_04010 [Terracidiphilus sp.]